MNRPNARSLDLEHELLKARACADSCVPFSPSWAAAIEWVEDVERELLVLERITGRSEQFQPTRKTRASELDRTPDLVLVSTR